MFPLDQTNAKEDKVSDFLFYLFRLSNYYEVKLNNKVEDHAFFYEKLPYFISAMQDEIKHANLEGRDSNSIFINQILSLKECLNPEIAEMLDCEDLESSVINMHNMIARKSERIIESGDYKEFLRVQKGLDIKLEEISNLLDINVAREGLEVCDCAIRMMKEFLDKENLEEDKKFFFDRTKTVYSDALKGRYNLHDLIVSYNVDYANLNLGNDKFESLKNLNIKQKEDSQVVSVAN